MIPCKECSFVGKDAIVFEIHTFVEHSESIKDPSVKYQCDECGKQFKYKRSMKAHKAIHNDPIIYDCDICSRQYKSYSSLKRHALDAHATATNTFECKVCFQMFRSKNLLARHIRRQHKVSKTLDCDRCGKSFKEGSKLKRHMDAVHLQIMKQCDICGGEYKDLGIHKKRIHFVLIGTFQCSLCDKVFSKRDLQQIHMKTTHQNTMKRCNVCDKSFLQLKKHIIRKHSAVT